MKPVYTVIHKNGSVGLSFVLKANAKHHAKVHNALGIVKLNSVNAINWKKAGCYEKHESISRKLTPRTEESCHQKDSVVS